MRINRLVAIWRFTMRFIKAKKLKTKKRPIFVNETGRLSLLIKENVFSIITVPNHWEQEFLLQRHLFAEQRNLKVHSAD